MATRRPSVGEGATGADAAGALAATAAGAREDPAADDEERVRRRLELQLEEVRAKWGRAKASPSPLGEDLCGAAMRRTPCDVRRLLDSGADVNYVSCAGLYPLMSVFHNDYIGDLKADVVSLLLERGADARAINVYGRTALHYASSVDGSGRCVALLLGAGADVDARDRDGATPLHCAVAWHNEAAVRALLAAGANKNLRCWAGDEKNKMPFNIAGTEIIRNLLS